MWGTAAGSTVSATGNRYVFAESPTITVTARVITVTADAGTYDITQGTLSASDNYDVTFVAGSYTLEVVPASAAIADIGLDDLVTVPLVSSTPTSTVEAAAATVMVQVVPQKVYSDTTGSFYSFSENVNVDYQAGIPGRISTFGHVEFTQFSQAVPYGSALMAE